VVLPRQTAAADAPVIGRSLGNASPA